MKNYLLSLIILIVMAASATAMPTMKSAGGNTEPTAKNHEKLIADLKLSKKEAEPVRKILSEYRKDLVQWAVKHGPEMVACRAQMKKYHQMRDPKVMKAIRAAMKRLGELSKERVGIREAMIVKLKGVMTREQFAIAADALRPFLRTQTQGFREKFSLLGGVNLTKEQLEKIRATSAAEMKPPPDGSPRKGNPMELAWNKIVKEVLTKENHKELADLIKKSAHQKMVMDFVKSVRLTPEQTKKISTVWDKAYADAKKSPKSKFDIYNAARTEAMEKILTKKQLKQIEAREKNPHGGKMGTKVPGIPMPPARPHTPKKKK
ncbi:MAG: hypothetical protein QGH60_08520 [Phycisphaerae bacterium]|jgi:hypothetical protein|nr:hypothetical protein [Phycisphaerae bacterium]